MIRSINIKNIQSHKDTTLEFSPGINAIVGSSNNGKSAVLRALYWAVYNRPLGTDTLLSHWATDKKGNQIAPMSVTVENDNGTVTRRRTKTENQYIVNDEELNVVKTDVPTQVEELLRLSDTNIQKQQDAPFLLSLTSGQVAQYFNKTVRLDVIDKVLSNAESKRRKTMNDIKQTEELLAEFENKKEKYSWLNAVEKLLVKYDNITSKVEQNRQQIETLRQQVEEFDKCKKITAKLNSIVAVKKTVAELQKQQQALEEITARREERMAKMKSVIQPMIDQAIKSNKEAAEKKKAAFEKDILFYSHYQEIKDIYNSGLVDYASANEENKKKRDKVLVLISNLLHLKR